MVTRTVEYSQLGHTPPALREVIDTAPARWSDRITIELAKVCAGWETAGSMARITDGYTSVRYELGGAWHGRRFADPAAAHEYFASMTAPPHGAGK